MNYHCFLCGTEFTDLDLAAGKIRVNMKGETGFIRIIMREDPSGKKRFYELCPKCMRAAVFGFSLVDKEKRMEILDYEPTFVYVDDERLEV